MATTGALAGQSGALADGGSRDTATVAPPPAEVKSSQPPAEVTPTPAKSIMNANAKQIPLPTPRPVRRKIANSNWHCSGPWCGRHFVLMLGVAY